MSEKNGLGYIIVSTAASKNWVFGVKQVQKCLMLQMI